MLKLDAFQESISASPLFEESVEAFGEFSISEQVVRIRCLALGSPSESNAALYQLAYLNELVKLFKIDPLKVSLYDPVFVDADIDLFEKLQYTVDTVTPDSFESDSTLFYLPHADLKLTEDVILTSEPRFLLGNWVLSHTESFTKKKLFDEYKIMALLKNSMEEKSISSESSESSEFTIVKKKRNNKLVYVEPKIDYCYDEVYFKEVLAKKFDKIKGIWGNAFSDLALHEIKKRISAKES